MAIREYRSNMFSMLLREPRYALEVYNALNDSNYEREEDVEIFCLENGISLSVRNDASFLFDSQLNIYEQQSTVNPNMPLRAVIYFANLIKKIIEENGMDIYDIKLVCIPNPRFVVFYNGRAKYPEVSELRLSDAFINNDEKPELELKCIVYNINPDNNDNLKSKSPMLCQYMEFVESVKAKEPFTDREALKVALEQVIADFIKNDKLKEFLLEHGDEVVEMETLDFTFERREELIKKNYFEDGLEQGLDMGLEIINQVKRGEITLEAAADRLGEKAKARV